MGLFLLNDNKLMTDKDILHFKSIVGTSNIVESKTERFNYAHDETEDLVFYPSIVLKPANAAEVSHIMKYCNENNLKITPQGERTGLSGGALPLDASIALSMERFNKIIIIVVSVRRRILIFYHWR